MDAGGTGQGAGLDEDIPAFSPPLGYPLRVPPFIPPRGNVPKWMAPCEPRPIGFMRGAGKGAQASRRCTPRP